MICNGLKKAAMFIVFVMLVSGCFSLVSKAKANRDYEITKPITPDELYVMSVKACKKVDLQSYSLGNSTSEVRCNGNYYELYAIITANKDRKTVKSIELSVTGQRLTGGMMPGHPVSDADASEIADKFLKALKAMIEEN